MENNSKRSRDDLIRLSRTVSHALRHAPEEYGIQLDGSGWIEIAELLKALQDKSKHWNDLAAEDLHLMASAGEKPRYEFEGSRIRAAYGHSISAPIQYEESVPPARLFHGTTEEAAARISDEGIRSMKRQYVHLSADADTAVKVALRRTSNPVILEVDAKAAYDSGIKFYLGNDNIWLASFISREFISLQRRSNRSYK